MLSSSESDGEIQRALRSGASAYVLKGMPQDELLAVIRFHIKNVVGKLGTNDRNARRHHRDPPRMLPI